MTDSIEPRRLETLADEIRAEVDAAEAGWQSAVGHAITAGEKLTEAKQLVKHGEWLPWLEANFPLSERTARNYMRLAAKSATVADLPSVRDALAMLAPPSQDERTAMSRDEAMRRTAECQATLGELRQRCRDGRAAGVHLTLGYSTWEQYVALERILEPPTDVARDVDAELLAPLRRLLWEACASNEKS
ncbi:MAG: DUF3102 domain-containing protein [Solirubrobacteraceae bacterium]